MIAAATGQEIARATGPGTALAIVPATVQGAAIAQVSPTAARAAIVPGPLTAPRVAVIGPKAAEAIARLQLIAGGGLGPVPAIAVAGAAMHSPASHPDVRQAQPRRVVR